MGFILLSSLLVYWVLLGVCLFIQVSELCNKNKLMVCIWLWRGQQLSINFQRKSFKFAFNYKITSYHFKSTNYALLSNHIKLFCIFAIEKQKIKINKWNAMTFRSSNSHILEQIMQICFQLYTNISSNIILLRVQNTGWQWHAIM